MAAATTWEDVGVPFHLLSGLVRNAREAKALVELDVSAVRQHVLFDHLLASCAQERSRHQ